MKIVKQRYYNKNNPQNRQFISDHSDYDHVSKGYYYKYLNRLPRSQYQSIYESMLKQGNRIRDDRLITLANKKLDSLQKGFANVNYMGTIIKSNPTYNPTFISDIISHDNEVLHEDAYLHYLENVVKESLKLPTYYMNSYGVYHNDTFHPHIHVVLYQDQKFFTRKPINEKNSKFYLNKKQLKRLKKAINYQYSFDIRPYIDKETVINNLIQVIKLWKYPNNITKKKRFTLDLLINLVTSQKIVNPELMKLKRVMYRYKNYNASHNKNVDFSILDPKSNTYSVAILKNMLDNKIQTNKDTVYLKLINLIRQYKEIDYSILKKEILPNKERSI